MPTVFASIIAGEIPARFVYRDERCVSFMDVRPLARGHALVVPREEIDHWTDLDVGLASHLMAVAHRVGNAQMELLRPARIGLVIAGFEVPHVHVHVVPVNSMADLDFRNADSSPDADDLDWLCAELAGRLAAG